MKIYALNDSKLGEFGQPFFFQAHGLALRFLADLVKDGKTTVAQHPEDFRLYFLGEYDPRSGTFTSVDSPEFVGRAMDFVETPPVALPPNPPSNWKESPGFLNGR